MGDRGHWELRDDGTMTPLNARAEAVHRRSLAAQLPAARVLAPGGVPARIWRWLCRPAIDRRCARCHERLEADPRHYRGIPRCGERLCRDATGERCEFVVLR